MSRNQFSRKTILIQETKSGKPRSIPLNQTAISWHGLRKTFATRLAYKGLDIYEISKLLGNEDVRTTQKRYAHHCTESLRVGEILDVDYN